jgi:hypothetical protein
MNDHTSAQASPRLDSDSTPALSDQRPSVAAIEFMTFHHEVLAAFCKHTTELNINTLVISPSKGINRAIERFAADSFTRLADLARVRQTEFDLVISKSPMDTASRILEADSIFIGTIPPAPTSDSSKSRRNKARVSSHDEMIHITREALKINKPVYIVIHRPREDATQLLASLGVEACKKVSAIYLSKDTARYCQQHFPNQFNSELIMPAIGLMESSSRGIPETKSGINIVVAGEISSKRRQYETLACLCSDLEWLRSQNIIIRIVGRIKLESWLEKLLRICLLPASYLFLVKYPSLLPLWQERRLDLSMARYSKVSDQALANTITTSACLLDLKRKHYSDFGQTTGALGLAMTHQRPLINLEAIKALISNDQQSSNRFSIQTLVKNETKKLIADKENLITQFRQQLLKELTLAASTQDLTTI